MDYIVTQNKHLPPVLQSNIVCDYKKNGARTSCEYLTSTESKAYFFPARSLNMIQTYNGQIIRPAGYDGTFDYNRLGYDTSYYYNTPTVNTLIRGGLDPGKIDELVSQWY